MRSLFIFILSLVTIFSRPPTVQAAGPPEDLARLVVLAQENNPEVKASEARWQMYRNRVMHQGRLEDPMLMLKIQNGIVSDPFNFSKDPMTQKVIGISQQLPFWGKRKLRQEVAEKEAESFRWSVEERKLELARMVKENYYQIYFVDKAVWIIEKNIKIISDFITLAETKYSLGQGAQQDVFKAQLEKSKMLDMKINLEQQRKTLQANLNALLFRPAETPIGSIADFSPSPLVYNNEQLLEMSNERRPLLKSLRALIEKGHAGEALSKKEFYPDFTISFEYMQRDATANDQGLDMYSLGVTFNLPVFTMHRHEMVAESQSEINMATEELNGARNGIAAGIADTLAQMERRRKLIELYRTGIIPQAEQTLESATISYRVNKVDFLALLDSRVTLFNYERDYYESLADYQIKLAQLEALVGKELP